MQLGLCLYLSYEDESAIISSSSTLRTIFLHNFMTKRLVGYLITRKKNSLLVNYYFFIKESYEATPKVFPVVFCHISFYLLCALAKFHISPL